MFCRYQWVKALPLRQNRKSLGVGIPDTAICTSRDSVQNKQPVWLDGVYSRVRISSTDLTDQLLLSLISAHYC